MKGKRDVGGGGPVDRVFGLFVRLHPTRFREDFGQDMLETFRGRRRDAASEGRAGACFYTRELAGVFTSALREWTTSLRTDRSSREAKGETMGKWIGDVKHALRRLAKTPSFTLVAALTLALGIGANAAIFSVVNGVLLKPLTYPDSHRLTLLLHTAPGLNLPQLPLSRAMYVWYRAEARSFSDLALTTDREMTITGVDDPERLTGRLATWSVFNTMGMVPVTGRTFVEEDGLPGAPTVVVVSEGYWERRLGGSPDAIGRTLEVDGTPAEIVGVVKNGSLFVDTEVWRPLTVNEASPDASSHGFFAVARLAPGVTLEDARTEMDGLVARLPEVYPEHYPPTLIEGGQVSADLRDLKERVVGDMRRALWVVLGTVGFVLLIACANVANLFIVRAEGRQQEVAIRRALGADRASLMRFFSGEALVLGAVGGAGGVGLAWAGVTWLRAAAPTGLPRVAEIQLDPVVLAFAGALSVGSALLFGVLPMWGFARKARIEGLREGTRGATQDRGRLRARSALVVAQVALALVLLIGSGLLVRSFQSLRAIDPGFDQRDAITFRLSLSPAAYPEPTSVAGFYADLVERLEGIPGVVVAGAARNLPLTDGRHGSGIYVEGQPLEEGDLPMVVEEKSVSEGYFEAMGIRLLAGRVLERRDHEARTGAAVVSKALADHYWPDGSALGKRLTTDDEGRNVGRWYTVVGVVESVRDQELTDGPSPVFYLPLLGHEEEDAGILARAMSIVLRVRPGIAPTSVLGAAEREVWALDPSLPVANPRTLEAIFADSMARTSFTMVLLAMAAGISLVLGAVGIFGVISYVVTQRTREIGIRLAVGAERSDVRRMVLGQGAKLVAMGAVVGLIGAALLARMVEALLHGVSARDPATYVGVTALLVTASTLAAWLPARRATRIDPVEALRME